MGVIFLILGVSYWMYSCAWSNEGRATEASQPQQRQQVTANNNSSGSSNSNNETRNNRSEEILYKFYFQTVLPDKSNTTAHSIRSTAGGVGETDEEEGCSG